MYMGAFVSGAFMKLHKKITLSASIFGFIFSIFLLSLLIPKLVSAQTVPDAGSLQQQIDRERRALQIQPKAPEAETVAPEQTPIEETAKVMVKGFRFEGNERLSSDELDQVVADFTNRELSFAQMSQAASAVAEAYRKAGWVVRAYLPEQDIVDGIVIIRIVEAVFGAVRIEGQEPERFSASQAIELLEAQQASGQPLYTPNIDRGLLLLDDLPGVSVSGTLTRGAKEGETDIALKLADEPFVTGDVNLDNTGSYSTGSDRLTANAYVNSPGKFGDQIAANLIVSEGNEYIRLAYSLPVGNDGLRIEASGSYLTYEIVNGPFANGDVEGSSYNVGLTGTYPVIRSRLKNLYASVGVMRKDFDNEAASVTTSDYEIDNVTIGLYGNLFDRWNGGGANSFGINLMHGKVDLGTIDSAENANLADDFNKINYYLSRQQYLTDDLTLYALVAGQEADETLDSAERFYLGGAYGVRAYPANEGSGSDGALANIELRWRAWQNLMLTGFYDIGQVRDTGLGNNLEEYTLKGAGLAANWTTDFGLNLKATWARRIGDNPNPTNTGRDQDSTLDKDRLWLQASFAF
jgi:hemolysin activation/secretion protein